MRILKLFLLTAGLSLLVLASCDLFTPQPEPGSRNYVWELDTLNMPMNYLTSVWGASPNDLWAVGSGGTHNDRLLHYNGTGWSTYTNEVIWCSGNVLFGFSNDDIWMGGGAGWLAHGAGIWYFDGDKWKQNYVYDKDSTSLIVINDIWGDSSDNIYTCGFIVYSGSIKGCRGFVLHYNGTDWSEVGLANFDSQFLRVRNHGADTYIFSYMNDSNTHNEYYELYHLNNQEFQKIYSEKIRDIASASLSNIDGNTYFTAGDIIYRCVGKRVRNFLKVDLDQFYHQAFGYTSNDIFMSMYDGIAHYNGIDIEYLYHFPNENMRIMGQPLIQEEDVYYCIYTLGTEVYNIILHGKLV